MSDNLGAMVTFSQPLPAGQLWRTGLYEGRRDAAVLIKAHEPLPHCHPWVMLPCCMGMERSSWGHMPGTPAHWPGSPPKTRHCPLLEGSGQPAKHYPPLAQSGMSHRQGAHRISQQKLRSIPQFKEGLKEKERQQNKGKEYRF